MSHSYYQAMMQDAVPVEAQLSSSNKRSPSEGAEYSPHYKTPRSSEHYPPPVAVHYPPPMYHRPRMHMPHHSRPGIRPIHPHQRPHMNFPPRPRYPMPRVQPVRQSEDLSNQKMTSKNFIRSYGPSSKYQVCLLIPSDVHPQINWAGRLIGQKGATIKYLRSSFNVNVFINTPNAPPNDNSYDPSIHPDHVKICATGGTLAECMSRVTQCVAEIEERFDPTWRDPNLQQVQTHDFQQETDVQAEEQ
jgi:hypothetical protein